MPDQVPPPDYLSARFRRGLTSQYSDLLIVKLVTISHPLLAAPIYLCDYEVDFISRGQLYKAVRFSITYPTNVQGKPPAMHAEIYNVTGDILDQIRPLVKSPAITLEVVYDKFPDDIELKCPDFMLSEVTYDVLKIEGDLTLENYTRQPWPAGRFNPSLFTAII
jgi:hypothetical protein